MNNILFDKNTRKEYHVDSHFGVNGNFGGGPEVFEEHLQNIDFFEVLDEKGGRALIETVTNGESAFFLAKIVYEVN